MFCMLFNLKNDFFYLHCCRFFSSISTGLTGTQKLKKNNKKKHWEWKGFVDNDLLQSTLGVRSEVFIAYVLFRCHQVLLN